MTSKEKLFLVIVFLLAFAYRIYILSASTVTFFSDDAIYAEIARFWVQGKWNLVFHPTWQPLYPFLSAIFYLLIGNWENATRLVSAVSGSLLIISLYFCAKNFLPRIQLFLYLSTITFFTPILNRSLIPMSDMLFTFLIISAFTAMFYTLQSLKKKHICITAATFGLAYLTRSEAFIFVALSAIFLLVFLLFKRLHIKKIVSTLFLFVAVFIFVSSPYLISTKAQLGKWTFSQKGTAQIKQGHAFQVRDNGLTWSQEIVSIKEPNYKSTYYFGGVTHILEYSDWYWWWFMEKLGKWKNSVQLLFPSWAILLIALGSLFSLKGKHKWFFLYLFFLSSIIIPLTIFATPLVDIRYLLWLFPFFILQIYIFFANFKKLSFLALIATFFLSSFSVYPFFSYRAYASEYTAQYSWSELAEAGNWLTTQQIKNPRIMMKHEAIEFYSDGYTVYTPQDFTLDQTIAYAKKLNADYLVAWTNELAGDKNLSVLLTDNFESDQLKRVYITNKGSRQIIIYQIID